MNTYKENQYFIISGFAIQLIFIVLIVTTSVTRLSELEEHFDKVENGYSLQKDYLTKMRNSVRDRSISVWKSTLTVDPFERNIYYEEFLSQGEKFIRARENFLKTKLNEKEQNIMEEMTRAILDISPIMHQIMESLNNNPDFNYSEKMSIAFPLQQKVVKSLDELLYLHTSQLQKVHSNIHYQLSNTLHIMIVLMLVAFLLGIIFAAMIYQRSHKMLRSIHNSESRLEIMNKNLENIVASRTAELEAANKELEVLANYDKLTGLANRLMLFSKFELILSYAKRTSHIVAVLFIDLDGFKPINDEYGHDVGDVILIEIAKRIKALTRDSDIASRFGGDEFVIILSALKDKVHAHTFIIKLLHEIEKTIFITEIQQGFSISASIGVSFYPDDSVSSEQLIKQADNAMYNNKKSK